jgi:proton glutamate symport protein
MDILGNGYTTLIAALCGCAVGLMFPNIGDGLKPFSDIFLTLISISVIPIIFSSVTSSIIKLIAGETKDIKIIRVICVFVAALIVASFIGIACGIILNPSRGVAESEFVADIIFRDMQKSIAVLSVTDSLNTLQSFSFTDFLTTLLPKNPFEAFARGNVIQILAISIFVGIAVVTLGNRKRAMVLSALSILMALFKGILQFPVKILPIGIFLLLASSLSSISIDVLLSMKNFCWSAMVAFAIIIVIAMIVLWIYSPIGLIKSIQHLKESITVAFSTCSNQATLPFLTSTLSKKFGLDESAVDLAIPLGVTMCRTSNAAYYSFVVIFIAALYNEPLSAFQYMFIVFGAILASLAASGASGVIAISMISIILDPLNLPIGSVLVILVTVDSIMEPVRAVTSLIMNAAVSCAVINPGRRKAICA